MKALVIVDVQNDFLSGGTLAVPDGDAIIDIINQLQGQFPLVVATKDWHPPHHISFAMVHGKQPGDVIEIQGMKQELWPVHCVQNSPGSELHSRLNCDKIEKVFFKGSDPELDSYSAFYDNEHLRSTGLGEYLLSRGVEEIYIVGLTTDYCVKYSVLDALNMGFKTHVILEGCRGINLHPQDTQKALHAIQQAGAIIDSYQDFYLGQSS